ncbi:hypothetical protein [Nesterenkonia flava]|uniref:Uncharacterized protein n=1 Tax=Nesterenkonia flava TaxID=469799 RepID=A0ABU1FRZ3_9MICC|nr:hypothetical protein [Nesterenkonia flava]MDR5711421.1 hypothetical protein [Nesterenkonia flava]
MNPEKIEPGDRLQFDGKRTGWLVRGITENGRYALATASMFGDVYYTIIDESAGVRGAMNIIGGGLGIKTISGPDPDIDEAIEQLETGEYGWGISHRNQVRLNITGHKKGSADA